LAGDQKKTTGVENHAGRFEGYFRCERIDRLRSNARYVLRLVLSIAVLVLVLVLVLDEIPFSNAACRSVVTAKSYSEPARSTIGIDEVQTAIEYEYRFTEYRFAEYRFTEYE
jgi:hypothetical protein